MLSAFEQFSMLLPSATHSGAAHAPEEGRYVESILRATLAKHLPASIEVLTGFIVDPNPQAALQSPQLDILVFDSSRYPKYEQFENTVIVPKQGVLAVISVKKTLVKAHIADECAALREVGNLCGSSNGETPPFLALVGFQSGIDPLGHAVFDCIEDAYPVFVQPYSNNELVELVTVIENGWSIRKQHEYQAPSPEAKIVRSKPGGKTELVPAEPRAAARYHYFRHTDDEHDLSLQFLLRGILKVFYGRSSIAADVPIKTAFEAGRKATRANIGSLAYKGENRHFLRRGPDPLLAKVNESTHGARVFLQGVSAPASQTLTQAAVVPFVASTSARLMPVDFDKGNVRIDFGKARRVALRFGLPEDAYVDALYLFQMAKQWIDTLGHPGGSNAADLWARAVKSTKDSSDPLKKLAVAIDAAGTVFALAVSRRYAASRQAGGAAAKRAAKASAKTSVSAVSAVPPVSPIPVTLQPAWDAYIVDTGYFKALPAASKVSDVTPARLFAGLSTLLAAPGPGDADTLTKELNALLQSDLR